MAVGAATGDVEATRQPMTDETPARDEDARPEYRQPVQERGGSDETAPRAPLPIPLSGPPRPETGPIPSER
jgi:hypothetical protein